MESSVWRHDLTADYSPPLPDLFTLAERCSLFTNYMRGSIQIFKKQLLGPSAVSLVFPLCLQAVAGQRTGLFSLLSFLQGLVLLSGWKKDGFNGGAGWQTSVFQTLVFLWRSEGCGDNISVSNELQRSVVIQWHLCTQSIIPITSTSNGQQSFFCI